MTTNDKKRESMVFYRSFYEAIKSLEPVQQAEVYGAIFEFGLNGIEPEMSGLAKAIFTLVKPQIVANNARYFNGQKGGKPRSGEEKNEEDDEQNLQKEQENAEPNPNLTETKGEPNSNLGRTKTKPKANQTKTKPEPNVNDNVNVNDRMDIEDISTSFACAREEVIHNQLYNVLNVRWLRQQLEHDEVHRDKLPLFDEYVQALENADTDKKVEALQRLDAQKFSELFNALLRMRTNGEKIDDLYRYVWKSVLTNAEYLQLKESANKNKKS